MTDQRNGPPKKDEAPKDLTNVEGLPHPNTNTLDTTGVRWLAQFDHADLGLVDLSDEVGS